MSSYIRDIWKALEFDSVVILSPFFWNFHDDMPLTTQHFAREFARFVPTVLVEPPPQWNFRSEHFRVHRLLHGLFGARTRSPQANLIVFHRRALPFGRFEFVRNLNLARNAQALRHVLEGLGFRRTLLWHSFPYWSEPLLEAVKHKMLVYHCLDHSKRQEEIGLIRRADVVFCVSETLVEKHRNINPHTYLLPNGVDLSLFDKERATKGRKPADLPASGRYIGFLGSINRYVDIELLIDVARAFPNDNLILVGKILSNETAPFGRQKEALNTLQSMSNVRILGFKPTQQLPIYLHAFDVCLIPFLKEQFNQECDPLKFYEYMAMGKPVVTTPVVPVAERYRNLCYIGDSPSEFVRCISLALNEHDPERRCQARVALARSHGWEELVKQACQHLQEVGGKRATSDMEEAE